MKTLHITVADKVATYRQRDGLIVCGNKDYQIEFVFGEEWGAHLVKTARFIWGGQYYDEEFEGTTCPVPMITGTTEVLVGVYAGDLCTTTAARIWCVPSILCKGSSPHPETGQNYTTEAQKAAQEAEASASKATSASEAASEAAQAASEAAEEAKVSADSAERSEASVRSMLAVTPRSYVVETIKGDQVESSSLEMLLSGRLEIGELAVYADELQTGDNILVVEHGVPDFWFEKTDDATREAERYTYTDADGNTSELTLVVYDYAYPHGQMGLLHILESDYTVIEGYSKAASTAAQEAENSARNADTDASRAESAAENAEAEAERAEAAADRAELFGDAFAPDASVFSPVNIIADGAPGIEEDAFWGTSGLLTGYTSYKSYAELLGVAAGAEYLIPQFKGVISFYNADKTKHTNIDFTSGSLADRRFTVPDGSVWMGVSFNYKFDPAAYIHRLTPTEDERAAFPIYSERLLVKQKNIGTSLARMISPVHGETIVNFGDSIFGNARPPEDVSTMLAELTGATVHNCAFGGCRMAYHGLGPQWDAFSMYRLADAIATNDFSLQDAALAYESRLSYAEEPVALLKSLDFSEIDIVTISYGTNDFTAGAEIDNAENQYDTGTVCGALRYSIERLLDTYPQLRIFVLLPTWRFWMDGNNAFTEDSDTRLENGHTLPEFCQALADVAEEYKLPVIDNYKELGINKFNRMHYFPATSAGVVTDGTHHNENGRRLIARHIAKKLF